VETHIPISLIVFDGDDTLFKGLDGGYLSGIDYQDDGRDDYTFTPVNEAITPEGITTIARNDGQRFRLYPEVRPVFTELEQRGVLLSFASYNRLAPTLSALLAFDLLHFFQHPTIEFNNRKDLMLQKILAAFNADGYSLTPQRALFIDDDHHGTYRLQMASIGVNFLQKGVDIHDLRELLDHPLYQLRSGPVHMRQQKTHGIMDE
jgi:magnesium-dependent phosphatase-1